MVVVVEAMATIRKGIDSALESVVRTVRHTIAVGNGRGDDNVDGCIDSHNARACSLDRHSGVDCPSSVDCSRCNCNRCTRLVDDCRGVDGSRSIRNRCTHTVGDCCDVDGSRSARNRCTHTVDDCCDVDGSRNDRNHCTHIVDTCHDIDCDHHVDVHVVVRVVVVAIVLETVFETETHLVSMFVLDVVCNPRWCFHCHRHRCFDCC